MDRAGEGAGGRPFCEYLTTRRVVIILLPRVQVMIGSPFSTPLRSKGVFMLYLWRPLAHGLLG